MLLYKGMTETEMMGGDWSGLVSLIGSSSTW